QAINNIVASNTLQRPRRSIAFVVFDSDWMDQIVFAQRLDNASDKTAGNTKAGRNFEQGWRARADFEALRQQRHDAKGDIFTAALAHVLSLFLLHVDDAVLESVSDLRAEQNDEPGEIQADEENGNKCQGGAIDRAHIHHLSGE